MAETLPADQLAMAALVRDAERWRALLGCGRVRVLGWVGLNDPASPYAHIRLELWTHHEFKEENEHGRETLTRFADKARETDSHSQGIENG